MLLLLIIPLFVECVFGDTTMISSKPCRNNPTFCKENGTYYYWTTGPRIIASTASGRVRGMTWSSRGGNNFYAFLGIPYGKIPMRFEPSRPQPKWDGIRDASNFGPMCMQLDRKLQLIAGVEDCLFINVYSPIQTSDDRSLLPVLVWIDGSNGWQHGSGDKVDPRNFMDEQVVLVTFNFRLSVFGFLSTDDGEVQGNMGLKDQILALMWVNQNIEKFNGDADRITIFGNDVGAASVHLLILSPLSKGLFHRAISQSGSAHCPWVMQKNAAANAISLAQMLDCDLSTTNSMVECMRLNTGEEVLLAELKMKSQNWIGEPFTLFGPTVEKVAFKSPPFITDTPRNIINTGEFNKIPWIIGFNEEDGRYFVPKILSSDYLINELNNNWNTIAPVAFLYNGSLSKDEVSEQLKTFYFADRPIGKEHWDSLRNIYTDRYYLNGITESIMVHANTSLVYPYIFRFQGGFSYTPVVAGDYRIKRGPSHFDELHYLFNWEWTTEPKPNDVDNLNQEFSKHFVKLWVSFAVTGIPKGWGTRPAWQPMNPQNPFVNWYLIDYDTMSVTEDPYKARVEFWKSLNVQDNVLTYAQRHHLFHEV